MKRINPFAAPQASAPPPIAVRQRQQAPQVDLVIVAGPDSELELAKLKEVAHKQGLNVHVVGDGCAPVKPLQIAQLKRTAGLGPNTHFIVAGHGGFLNTGDKEQHVTLGWVTVDLIRALAETCEGGEAGEAPAYPTIHLSACHIESILSQGGPNDPLWSYASCMLHGSSVETTIHQAIENLGTVIELLGQAKSQGAPPPSPNEIYLAICDITGESLSLIGGGQAAALQHDPLQMLPALIEEERAAKERGGSMFPDGPSEGTRAGARRKLENVFFTLINRGEAELLRDAIKSVPQLVHIRDVSGTTPLHLATEFGDPEAARLLLENAADVNARNQKGDFPLHLAVEYGHLEVAGLLVECGAAIDSVNHNGDTALSDACSLGQPEMADFLLRNGANPNLPNNHGWLPLHYACQNGDTDCITALLNAGVDPNCTSAEGYTPLQIAASGDQADAVALLLTLPGVNCNVQDNDGYTALHQICMTSAARTAALLAPRAQESFIRRDKDGTLPLEIALKKENREVVSALIAHGAALGYEYGGGVNLLHDACLRGSSWLWLCELLLQSQSVDIEARTRSGETALHHACATSDSADIVNMLIQLGAQIEPRDATGATPLAAACARGDADAVWLLLRAGASAATTDSSELTPLHHACTRLENALSIVERLLGRSEVNVNYMDAWGRTPLMYAAMRGHDEIVDVLLHAGADVLVQDDEEKTALQLVDRILEGDIKNHELFAAMCAVRQRLITAANVK